MSIFVAVTEFFVYLTAYDVPLCLNLGLAESNPHTNTSEF
jgi:hypothetical protein